MKISYEKSAYHTQTSPADSYHGDGEFDTFFTHKHRPQICGRCGAMHQFCLQMGSVFSFLTDEG